MAITDKKGINVTSGFKLVSGQPLDARLVAVDETDLQSLVNNGAVYDGMIVWVQSLNKYMSYNGTEFEELATGGGGTPAYVENETLFLGNVTTGGSGGGSSLNKTTITIPITSPIDSITGVYPITDSAIISDIRTMYENISNIIFSKYAFKMGIKGVLNIDSYGNLRYDVALTPDQSAFQIHLPAYITSHDDNGVATGSSLTGTSAVYDIINNSLTILFSEGDFETYNQMIDSGGSVNIIIEYYTL